MNEKKLSTSKEDHQTHLMNMMNLDEKRRIEKSLHRQHWLQIAEKADVIDHLPVAVEVEVEVEVENVVPHQVHLPLPHHQIVTEIEIEIVKGQEVDHQKSQVPSLVGKEVSHARVQEIDVIAMKEKIELIVMIEGHLVEVVVSHQVIMKMTMMTTKMVVIYQNIICSMMMTLIFKHLGQENRFFFFLLLWKKLIINFISFH